VLYPLTLLPRAVFCLGFIIFYLHTRDPLFLVLLGQRTRREDRISGNHNLREDIFDDFAEDVGQAEVTAGVTVG
jgi:hypothetical protein